MKTKNFEEMEIGDRILMDVPGTGLMSFIVSEIDHDERCVRCKNNYMDFYPNENDRYVILD